MKKKYFTKKTIPSMNSYDWIGENCSDKNISIENKNKFERRLS